MEHNWLKFSFNSVSLITYSACLCISIIHHRIVPNALRMLWTTHQPQEP